MKEFLDKTGLEYFYNKLCSIFYIKGLPILTNVTSELIKSALGYTPISVSLLNTKLANVNADVNTQLIKLNSLKEYTTQLGSKVDEVNNTITTYGTYIDENKTKLNIVLNTLDALNATILNLAMIQDDTAGTLNTVSSTLDAQNTNITNLVARANTQGMSLAQLTQRVSDTEAYITSTVSMSDLQLKVTSEISQRVFNDNGTLKSNITLNANLINIGTIGSTVKFGGELLAPTGTIGGWTINEDSISLGDETNGIYLTNEDENNRIEFIKYLASGDTDEYVKSIINSEKLYLKYYLHDVPAGHPIDGDTVELYKDYTVELNKASIILTLDYQKITKTYVDYFETGSPTYDSYKNTISISPELLEFKTVNQNDLALPNTWETKYPLKINMDGSGLLSNGNFSWDTSGNITSNTITFNQDVETNDESTQFITTADNLGILSADTTNKVYAYLSGGSGGLIVSENEYFNENKNHTKISDGCIEVVNRHSLDSVTTKEKLYIYPDSIEFRDINTSDGTYTTKIITWKEIYNLIHPAS